MQPKTLTLDFSYKPIAAYARENICAFYARDQQAIAESVKDRQIKKALIYRDVPIVLEINFGQYQTDCRAYLDHSLPIHYLANYSGQLDQILRRMLGLTTASMIFENLYFTHPLLGGLIQKRPGLAIPLTATPFEALIWAIIGQQITLTLAIQLRQRLILLADLRHSQGLYCFPDARCIANLTIDQLRELKLSQAKAAAIIDVSQKVVSNYLELDAWLDPLIPAEEIYQALLQVKGVGPWTAHYTLLRGYGYLDCSLEGDAVVRQAVQGLLQSSKRMTQAEVSTWLAQFTPWRSLVAAHLWADRTLSS